MLLHGELHEEIFIKQILGFIKQGQEHVVCKLKQSLYVLKKTPRQWNQKFGKYMIQLGYRKSEANLVLVFSML